MDQTQLQQKIAEYYVKLPEDLKVFFAEQEWLKNIEQISLKYKLTAEQTSILSTETTLLLLCIINIADYAQVIETELKLPEETFKQILDDIGETILKETYGKIENGYINNLAILEKENATEMQDVPLPPYKKQEETIKREVKAPEVIEIKPVTKTINEVNEQKLVDQVKKDVNFLAQKLSAPTITESSVSDHSLPNISNQSNKTNPIIKSHDPYREGLEL